MDLCAGCGVEVVAIVIELPDPPTVATPVWGVPLVCDRLMVRAGGTLGVREHQCRDYLAWHQPPDTRDPGVLDVGPGWQPRIGETKLAA